jgi:hypothetical protein
MSNYKKDDWCLIWEALYYSFLNKHYKMLKKIMHFQDKLNI